MSRAIDDAPVTRPVESAIGEIVSETSITSPSFRTRCVSKGSPATPRRAFSIIAAVSPALAPAGTISARFRPMTSAAL
jgi:hypothetical protein